MDHDAHQQLIQRSMHRVHIAPACVAQRCQQGRKPCPCPNTCRTEPEGWGGYFNTVALIACIALLAVLYVTSPGI